MKTSPAERLLSVALLSLVLVFAGCGRKGAPTLRSFEKPAAPTGLSAVNRENSIYISWSFPKDKEITVEQFLLLRSDGVDFAKIAGLAGGARSYIDRDISMGRQYRYKVVSQNQRGIFSDQSNTAELTPQSVPSPPRSVTFRASETSLELRWQGPGGLLYNVYKTASSGSYSTVPVNAEPLASMSFTDTFDLGRKVYYTVRSLTDREALNESSPSEEITVDPGEFVPGPPSDLGYFASESRVYLTWKEPAETWITGFRVYRSAGGGEYSLIGQPQAPAFIDSDAVAGDRAYRVHAVGPVREGSGIGIKGVRIEEQR